MTHHLDKRIKKKKDFFLFSIVERAGNLFRTFGVWLQLAFLYKFSRNFIWIIISLKSGQSSTITTRRRMARTYARTHKLFDKRRKEQTSSRRKNAHNGRTDGQTDDEYLQPHTYTHTCTYTLKKTQKTHHERERTRRCLGVGHVSPCSKWKPLFSLFVFTERELYEFSYWSFKRSPFFYSFFLNYLTDKQKYYFKISSAIWWVSTKYVARKSFEEGLRCTIYRWPRMINT